VRHSSPFTMPTTSYLTADHRLLFGGSVIPHDNMKM
jgi:hypothetical protein